MKLTDEFTEEINQKWDEYGKRKRATGTRRELKIAIDKLVSCDGVEKRDIEAEFLFMYCM